jgi:hypothetical protein
MQGMGHAHAFRRYASPGLRALGSIRPIPRESPDCRHVASSKVLACLALSMNIKDVITTIKRMETDGVIDRYAIGGAVGATFYLEPVATLDVDIFVVFRSEPGSVVLSPQPVFDYLKARGFVMDGEYIVIGGWPVQFLPATGPLVEEALAQAVESDVDGVPARVFRAEHLAAIALQTGRAKDKARLLQFVESAALDTRRFQDIVVRHGLEAAWQRFEGQFLSDTQ